MKQTIRKLFWAWEFEKEEKWLNEMAAKGLQLSSVGFGKYVFEEGVPGEYMYRLELLENLPTHAESVQYIQFLKEMEVEHIGSLFRWVYFRKKAGATRFDLFSDMNSRIKHLSRILLIIGIFSGLNLLNGINNLWLWSTVHIEVNLVVSVLCLLVGLLLGCGFFRLLSQKHKLKKEKILHEYKNKRMQKRPPFSGLFLMTSYRSKSAFFC